jgi:hypothetical protein
MTQYLMTTGFKRTMERNIKKKDSDGGRQKMTRTSGVKQRAYHLLNEVGKILFMSHSLKYCTVILRYLQNAIRF